MVINMEKVTKREVLEKLAQVPEVKDSEMFMGYIAKELENLEKRNAYRRNKAKDADDLTDEIKTILFAANEPMTIANIEDKCETADVTPAKITARLTQLVDAGLVERTEVKIEKRKVKGYKIVETDAE